MSIALAFWITFLIWIILSCYQLRGFGLGANIILIILIILIGLLGWKVFGPPPIHG